MNTVALTIPFEALLAAFPLLPQPGTIDSATVVLKDRSVRVIYRSPGIRTPWDFPMEYERWVKVKDQPVAPAPRLPAVPPPTPPKPPAPPPPPPAPVDWKAQPPEKPPYRARPAGKANKPKIEKSSLP